MRSAAVLFYTILQCLLWPIWSHVPEYLPTPSSKIDQYCLLSETCLHDTVPICGSNGDTRRTFLDICDLLEYACDTGHVFVHIEDSPGCPINRD